MNYKACMFLGLSLLASTVMGSPRSGSTHRGGQKAEENNVQGHQQIVMIPVSLASKPAGSSEEQRDREFFLTLLSIAANFGNAVLNKDNMSIVIPNIGNMMNGIVQAADIITKYQKRGISMEQLRELLARVFREQAHHNINRVRAS